MNVNFTGISSLKIAQRREPINLIGNFHFPNGKMEQKPIQELDYKISYVLDNDKNGRDLDDFLKVLDKSGNHIDNLNNDSCKIDLILEKYDFEDEYYGPRTFSKIKINDEDVTLCERKGLALYEYLAHLTKRFIKNFNLSNNQKDCIQLINQSIHDSAVNFIDNMQ